MRFFIIARYLVSRLSHRLDQRLSLLVVNVQLDTGDVLAEQRLVLFHNVFDVVCVNKDVPQLCVLFSLFILVVVDEGAERICWVNLHITRDSVHVFDLDLPVSGLVIYS